MSDTRQLFIIVKKCYWESGYYLDYLGESGDYYLLLVQEIGLAGSS